MRIELEKILHARVSEHCDKLFQDGHYKHAAHEAMKQVELALKEKSGVKNKYGTRLVSELFGQGSCIKLHLPFGEDMQQRTEAYFKACFQFYRNYAAHDGSKIDESTSLRILVIASELLELIGASTKSFADIGGIRGVIKLELFSDENSIYELMRFLDGYTFPLDCPDGYFEDLAEKGYGEEEPQSLVEIGLIEFKTGDCGIPEDFARLTGHPREDVGWFQLTNQGRQCLLDAEKSN